jgi:hypothetical protein
MIENRGLRVEGAKSSRGSNAESRAAFVPARDYGATNLRPAIRDYEGRAAPPIGHAAACPYRDWNRHVERQIEDS